MAVNDLNLTHVVPSKRSKTEVHVPHAYVETPNIDPTSMDVLRQFQANMATLEDLNGRLRFMMTEIRGLIRK